MPQTIDLSAGLIPKAGSSDTGAIDLSAGLIPRQTADAPRQTGMGAFLGSSGVSTLAGVLRHPGQSISTAIDAAKRVVSPGQPEHMSDNPNPILRGVGQMVEPFGDAIKHAWQQPSVENMRQVARTVPILGPGIQQAQHYHDQGNTPAAVGTLLGTVTGLAAPEALKLAPETVARLGSSAGEVLQDSGANRMDRFLNGGKKLPVGEYDAPGRTVLAQGPMTSVARGRPQLTEQIRAARQANGPAVSAAYQGSSARIPLPEVRSAVDSTIDPMRRTASGPGGNPSMGPRFDQLRQSFGPLIDLNGTTTPGALHQVTRTLDDNINWNRGPDPIDATARNASRQIRGKLRTVLNQYAPEGIEPSQVYHNLSDALELSKDHQNIPAVKGGLGRIVFDVVAGLGAGTVSGSPLLGAGAALGTHIAPAIWRLPIVQTGLSTGLFQAGRAAEAVGAGLRPLLPRINALVDRLGPLGRIAPLDSPIFPIAPQLQPPADDVHRNEYQQPADDENLNQSSQQIAPPGSSDTSIRLGGSTGGLLKRNAAPVVITPRKLYQRLTGTDN